MAEFPTPGTPGDAVGLAVGVRNPGDQVRRKEFTHTVQIPGIAGLEQVRCDIERAASSHDVVRRTSPAVIARNRPFTNAGDSSVDSSETS